MDPFHSKDFVKRLTGGKCQKRSQKRVLSEMGVEFIEDGDGWPLVWKVDFKRNDEPVSKPDWSVFR